jgi:hypothetical protein
MSIFNGPPRAGARGEGTPQWERLTACIPPPKGQARAPEQPSSRQHRLFDQPLSDPSVAGPGGATSSCTICGPEEQRRKRCPPALWLRPRHIRCCCDGARGLGGR